MGMILGLLDAHPDWYRTRLSRELCARWDWRNAQGHPNRVGRYGRSKRNHAQQCLHHEKEAPGPVIRRYCTMITVPWGRPEDKITLYGLYVTM